MAEKTERRKKWHGVQIIVKSVNVLECAICPVLLWSKAAPNEFVQIISLNPKSSNFYTQFEFHIQDRFFIYLI